MRAAAANADIVSKRQNWPRAALMKIRWDGRTQGREAAAKRKREGGQEEQEQDRKASKGPGGPAQEGEEQQRGRPNQEKRADKNEGGTLPLKTGTPQSSPTQWWGGRGGGHVPERMCDALDG